MELQNKVAIITGAAGVGCGRAIALRFALKRALVIVSDINEEAARETIRQIKAAGANATMFNADVQSEREVHSLIAYAEQTYGGLDILVNNASALVGGNPFEGWTKTVETDLLGAMYGTRLGIEAMRRRGGGAIVNIGSTSSLAHGRSKAGGWPAYDAAKAGVMRLTTGLAALRDSDSIRVNCLVPHWIAVPEVKEYVDSLTPEQRVLRGVPPRLITVDEIAAAVEYLAVDESLGGRLLIFWDDGARLIPWADPGYTSLEPVPGLSFS